MGVGQIKSMNAVNLTWIQVQVDFITCLCSIFFPHSLLVLVISSYSLFACHVANLLLELVASVPVLLSGFSVAFVSALALLAPPSLGFVALPFFCCQSRSACEKSSDLAKVRSKLEDSLYSFPGPLGRYAWIASHLLLHRKLYAFLGCLGAA